MWTMVKEKYCVVKTNWTLYMYTLKIVFVCVQ